MLWRSIYLLISKLYSVSIFTKNITYAYVFLRLSSNSQFIQLRNIGYSSETHLKPKSRETLFAYNLSVTYWIASDNEMIGKLTNRGYPAKRGLSAMRKHGG